jgi:maleylacetate reductase
MEAFVYSAQPARVLFGSGTLSQLAEEIDRLQCSRALLLSTPGRSKLSESVAAGLGPLAAATFNGAAMHTPVDVTERAMKVVEKTGVDCVVTLGGGSTIGLGKAIALRTDLPQIAVPTTYAGSEMTPYIGQTEDGVKTTQRTPKVLPETVIYDVDLSLSLPPALSATSGINAIAHAVEALYAEDRNPIISLMAEETIRVLAGALPRIAATPDDTEARSDALYGAWLCGMALGAVGVALHHKLCHALGGSFDLPHAETHAVVLPHAVAYNAPAAPAAMARIARALGVNDAAAGLAALACDLGAPRALKDLGMPEDGIDIAAEIATRNPYPNPRSIERGTIRDLIQRAWAGEPPAT